MAKKNEEVKIAIEVEPGEAKTAKVKAGIEEKYAERIQDKLISLKTLEWDDTANKYAIVIACLDCGNPRAVFTSDLFQVVRCEACMKEVRKYNRAKNRAIAKSHKLADKAEVAEVV